MNVKSVLTSLFTKRPERSTLFILIACLFSSSFTEHPDREIMTKQANIIIRKIGHHMLLQAGDSTSRVLPVTEMKTGTFLLSFQDEFVFHPDSLMALTKRLLTKSKFPSGFTLTVHDCANKSIVYGFQVNRTSPDILSCKGRIHPPGCYTIEFIFPDLNKTDKDESAASYQSGDGKTTGHVDAGMPVQSSQNTKVDKLNKQSVAEKSGFTENSVKDLTTPGGISLNLFFGGILVLILVAFMIGRFGKRSLLAPVTNHDNSITNETTPELPALGRFLFDVKGSRLVLDDEVIGLTDKECKVLNLLHINFGELIPRETLLQEVWIKEGVITGRSLDMFVSKLRKKLSGDPELRITNVHGKGYKLES